MRLILLATLLLLQFCTSTHAQPLKPDHHCKKSIALIISPAFSICAPLDFYQDSAVVAADDLSVKFLDGSFLFAKIVRPSTDGLPDSFDMTSYPAMAIGLSDATSLPAEHRQKFLSFQKEIAAWSGGGKPATWKNGELTFFLIKSTEYTEVFVTKDGRSDQLLLIGFDHVKEEIINTTIKGVR